MNNMFSRVILIAKFIIAVYFLPKNEEVSG